MLLQVKRSQLLVVDVQERLLPAMADPDPLTENARLLLQAARELGVTVLASEQYPKGLGRTVPQVLALLPVPPHEKVEFSCFANSTLRSLLELPDRQTVIAGIEAHVCVLQTALEMAAGGFDVSVVVDATSSRRRESKEIALHRLRAAGVRLVTAEMVVFEWLRQAGTPQFKTLSHLVR